MSAYVYKYEKEIGVPLYIGIATHLQSRLSQHGKPGDNIPCEYWEDINNAAIYYIKVPNRNAADFIETALISKYRPIANTAKNHDDYCELGIEEPRWVLYTKTSRNNNHYKRLSKEDRLSIEFNRRKEKQKKLDARFPDAKEAFYALNNVENMVVRLLHGETFRSHCSYIEGRENPQSDSAQIATFVRSWILASSETDSEQVTFKIPGNMSHYVFPGITIHWSGLIDRSGCTMINIGRCLIEKDTTGILSYCMPHFKHIKGLLIYPEGGDDEKLIL